MAKLSTKAFLTKNQELFEQYVSGNQTALEEMLELNKPMFILIANSISFQQYASCTYEDVLSETRTSFIQVLHDLMVDGETEYPLNMKPMLCSIVKRALNNQYINSGVAIPYSTKLLRGRMGVNDNESTISFEEMQSSAEDKGASLEASIIAQQGESNSLEDIIINIEERNTLMNALDKLPVKAKNIFLLKTLEGLTFEECGKRFNISECGAIYHYRKAQDALSKMESIRRIFPLYNSETDEDLVLEMNEESEMSIEM